jgi:hypothetical protein
VKMSQCMSKNYCIAIHAERSVSFTGHVSFTVKQLPAQIQMVEGQGQAPIPSSSGSQYQLRSQATTSVALPAGWCEVVDPSSGKTYYQNHVTRATQWDRPSA